MRVFARKVATQPLVHFLCLGALLFCGYAALGSGVAQSDEREIRVGREQLLTLLQQRARTFDRARFERELDAMSADQRQALEQDWLREEVLVREARSLGLDRDDYAVRQRLAQKMEFAARGFVEAGAAPDRAEVEQYFAAHRSDYVRAPTVTFTHVFFAGGIHGPDRARQLAHEALATLTRDNARFADAPRHGDVYAYHANYVERSEDYVAAQFDVDFARALFAGDAADGRWQGPLASPLGYHVVFVAGRQPARAPTLDEVYAEVAEDAREARVQRELQAVIDRLTARYAVSREVPRS